MVHQGCIWTVLVPDHNPTGADCCNVRGCLSETECKRVTYSSCATQRFVYTLMLDPTWRTQCYSYDSAQRSYEPPAPNLVLMAAWNSQFQNTFDEFTYFESYPLRDFKGFKLAFIGEMGSGLTATRSFFEQLEKDWCIIEMLYLANRYFLMGQLHAHLSLCVRKAKNDN